MSDKQALSKRKAIICQNEKSDDAIEAKFGRLLHTTMLLHTAM